jgi:muramoyltetrapeptide carboxypeptidase LdcA involved in peptidoglycan recycling
MPVVTNVDFGHTDPMWTIPLGTAVRIDPTTRAITFTEPAVVGAAG